MAILTIDADDKLEVIAYTRLNSQNGLMVWQANVDSVTGPNVRLQAVADQIALQVGTVLAPLLTEWAAYLGVSVQKISPDKGDKFISSQGGADGNVVGDALSTQTAGVVSLRTGKAGRAFRGRKYVPFPSEADNTTGGVPSGAYLTKLGNFAGIFLSGIGIDDTVTQEQAVISYGLWKPLLNEFREFTAYIVRKDWGTQRRRSQLNRGDVPPLP